MRESKRESVKRGRGRRKRSVGEGQWDDSRWGTGRRKKKRRRASEAEGGEGRKGKSEKRALALPGGGVGLAVQHPGHVPELSSCSEKGGSKPWKLAQAGAAPKPGHPGSPGPHKVPLHGEHTPPTLPKESPLSSESHSHDASHRTKSPTGHGPRSTIHTLNTAAFLLRHHGHAWLLLTVDTQSLTDSASGSGDARLV